MRIYFTYEDIEAQLARDYVLEAGYRSEFKELFECLAGAESSTYYWSCDGKAIAPEMRIGSVLRDGSVFTKSRTPQRIVSGHSSGVALLNVISGPMAGVSWKLGLGQFQLGRLRQNDVCLLFDEQVSRVHASLNVAEEGFSLRDSDSTNGILCRGKLVQELQADEGERFQVGDSVLSWRRPIPDKKVETKFVDGVFSFHRPPRIKPSAAEDDLVFPVMPQPKERSPLSIVGLAVPVLAGVGMAIFLHNPSYLLFTVLSPILGVANHYSDKVRGKRSYKQEMAEYQQEVDDALRSLSEGILDEERELSEACPDPLSVSEIACGPGSRLWERRPMDEEFLLLRIGLGDLPTKRVIKNKGPEMPLDELLLCRFVPMTIDLQGFGVVGLSGESRFVEGLARWLVAQLAVFQASEDVSIVIFADGSRHAEWKWAKWLPNLRQEGTQRVAYYGVDSSSIAIGLSHYADLVKERQASKGTGGSSTPRPRGIVLVLDVSGEWYGVPSMSRILSDGPEVGVYSLSITESRDRLPEECRAIIAQEKEGANRARLIADAKSEISQIIPDLVSKEWAEGVARSLAPLRLMRKDDENALIPRIVTLLEVLDAKAMDVDEVLSHWSRSRATRAVIGVSATGVVDLDLSRDGPHGIVAGTSGAGKSDFLQTLVASLAVLNPPWKMTFVLVDYKGGSAFGLCTEFPHTLGLVTDLDSQLTGRALVSLGAELERRERILAGVNAKDIDEYYRLIESGQTLPDLAHLLIVIDEFASMVADKDLKGFVDGLVDLARRGRSLGIHLLLATQKPSGVISPEIRANANLKVCMRVLDVGASSDVIDSPLAARIPNDLKGRGFIRSGNESLVEFQAAWSGALRREEVRTNTTIVLRSVEPDSVEPDPVEPGATGGVPGESKSELEFVSGVIHEAMARSGKSAMASPWLPPLPRLVALESLDVDDSPVSEWMVPFMYEDRPEQQRQEVGGFNLGGPSHLFVAGDGRSGRSTVLRTLAASMAIRYSASQVHLYVIDAGGGALRRLSELPHCGSVIGLAELERIERLLETLGRIIHDRQELISSSGYANFWEYNSQKVGGEILPSIVVFIDRWDRLTSVLEGKEADSGRLAGPLANIMRDSGNLGLHFVVSGDKTLLGNRMNTITDNILMLRFNDINTFASGGVSVRQIPKDMPPGRVLKVNTGVEAQVAILGIDPAGAAQTERFEEVIASCHARKAASEQDSLPERISELPDIVSLSTIKVITSVNDFSHRVLVGVGGNGRAVKVVDFKRSGPGVLVVGGPRSGRSNTLMSFGHSLLGNGYSVLWLYNRPSPLSSLGQIKGVIGSVDLRKTGVEVLGPYLRGVQRTAVLVDDVDNLDDIGVLDALTKFYKTAHDDGNVIIASGGVSEIASSFRGLAAEIKKARCGVVLNPSSSEDGLALSTKIPATKLANTPIGRAVLIDQGSVSAVQIPLADIWRDMTSTKVVESDA
ncbi:MAG: FtsK/SpoIIIE domain-containing protein [Ferrimicrobium sp.]